MTHLYTVGVGPRWQGFDRQTVETIVEVEHTRSRNSIAQFGHEHKKTFVICIANGEVGYQVEAVAFPFHVVIFEMSKPKVYRFHLLFREQLI